MIDRNKYQYEQLLNDYLKYSIKMKSIFTRHMRRYFVHNRGGLELIFFCFWGGVPSKFLLDNSSFSAPPLPLLIIIAQSLIFLCCIIFFVCFCFQSYFSPWLVFRFSYCWSIRASRGFCSKRISSDVYIQERMSSCYIILANSFTVHALPIDIWSTWIVPRALKESRRTIARLLKFHKRAAQICVFPRAFSMLRVTQLVLKIVHLAIRWNRVDPALGVSYSDNGSW